MVDISSKDHGLVEVYLSECEDENRTLEWKLSEATKEIARLNLLVREADKGCAVLLEQREAEIARLTLDNQRFTEMWDTDRELLTAEVNRLKSEARSTQTKECEFDPDHLYHDHREADELRAEVENLNQAIEQTWRPEVKARRAEVQALRASLTAIRAMVNQQAEDEGLWFIHVTASEAYLQQELRSLHDRIERLTA